MKKEEKGFGRLNRPYIDNIDKLFLKETGRSFYDLLKEEMDKWNEALQEQKKKFEKTLEEWKKKCYSKEWKAYVFSTKEYEELKQKLQEMK